MAGKVKLQPPSPPKSVTDYINNNKFMMVYSMNGNLALRFWHRMTCKHLSITILATKNWSQSSIAISSDLMLESCCWISVYTV